MNHPFKEHLRTIFTNLCLFCTQGSRTTEHYGTREANEKRNDLLQE